MTSENEHPQSTAEIAYVDDGDHEVDDATQPEPDGSNAALLPPERADSFVEQWNAIQAEFVDSPRDAVKQADTLVASVMQDLAKTFADERASLEQQWDRDEDVDTEALRMALQRYRSFFHRLLAA